MSIEPNPYQPPRVEMPGVPSFREGDSELSDLRRRVEELEKRVGRTWLVSPNRYLRILAVWGHLFIGYVLVAAVAWSIIGLFTLLMHLFGRPGPL